MKKKRHRTGLADKIAVAFAWLLLAVDLTVRSPSPVVTAPSHGNSDLAMCLIIMVPGFCVVACCLYLERHLFWEIVSHQIELRLRFARRKALYYPGLRRAFQLQRA
jgi:uncharacterized membrane protein